MAPSSTADRQARLSGFERFAQSANVVVVFPQAIEPIRAGYEWDPSQDVDFIAELVAVILSRHQTPHGRVIITGMSGGARMSSLFASVHPELVQVVGAVAGLRSPGAAVQRSSRSCRSTARRTGSTRTGAAARNVGRKASPTPPGYGRRPTASRIHRPKSP